MNKKLHILVWITLASLVSACQMHPKNGQPGFDPVDLHELRVVTSGGFAEAYHVLAPQFENKTGLKLITAHGSSSGGAPDSIPVRLERGEEFDVIILSQSSLNKLTELGELRPDSRTDLVSVHRHGGARRCQYS